MTSTYPSSPSARVIIGYNTPSTTAGQPGQHQQQPQQQQQQEHIVGSLVNASSSRKTSDAHSYRVDGNYVYENQAFGIPSSSINDGTVKNHLFIHNTLKSDQSRRDATLYNNGGNEQHISKNEVRIFMYPPSSSMEQPIVATTLSNAVNDLKLLVNGSTPSSSSASTNALPTTSLNGGNGYDGMTHILVQNRNSDGTHQQSYSMHQPSHILADRRPTLSYVVDAGDSINNGGENFSQSQRRDLAFGGDTSSENSADSHQLQNIDTKKRRVENENENDRARRRARDAETKRARRQRESSEQRKRRLLRDSQRMRRTRRIKRLLGPSATLSDLKKTGLTLEDLDSYSTGRRRGIRNTQSTYTSQQNQGPPSTVQAEQHHDSQQHQAHNNAPMSSMQIVAAAPPQNGAMLYDPRIQIQTQQQGQILSQQQQAQQQQSMVVPLVAASNTTVVQQPQIIQTQNGNYVTVHWTLPPGADPNQPPHVLHLPPGAPQHIIVQRSPPVTLALPEDGKPQIIHMAPPPAQPHHTQDGTIIASQPQMINQRHIINRSQSSTSSQQQQKPSSSQQHHHLQNFQPNASINVSYQQQPSQQLLQPQQHAGQQLIPQGGSDPQFHQTIVYRTAAPPLPRHQQHQQMQIEDYEIDDYKEFIVHRPAHQTQNLRQPGSNTQYHAQAQVQHQQPHPQQQQAQRPTTSQQLLQGVLPSTSYQVHQITPKGRRRSGVSSDKNAMPSVYTAVPPPPRGAVGGHSSMSTIVSAGAGLSSGIFSKRRSTKSNKKPKISMPPPPLSERFRGLTEEQIRRRRRANAERSRRRRQLETPEQRRERNRRTAERMRARRARIANERFTATNQDVTSNSTDTSTSDAKTAPASSYPRPRQVIPLSMERFEEIFQRVLERCRNPTADDTMLSAIALPHISNEMKDELQSHDEYMNLDVTNSSQNTSMDMVESILHTQMCATPSYIIGAEEEIVDGEEKKDDHDVHMMSAEIPNNADNGNDNSSNVYIDSSHNESTIQKSNSNSAYEDMQNEKLEYDAMPAGIKGCSPDVLNPTDSNDILPPYTNELNEEINVVSQPPVNADDHSNVDESLEEPQHNSINDAEEIMNADVSEPQLNDGNVTGQEKLQVEDPCVLVDMQSADVEHADTNNLRINEVQQSITSEDAPHCEVQANIDAPEMQKDSSSKIDDASAANNCSSGEGLRKPNEQTASDTNTSE